MISLVLPYLALKSDYFLRPCWVGRKQPITMNNHRVHLLPAILKTLRATLVWTQDVSFFGG